MIIFVTVSSSLRDYKNFKYVLHVILHFLYLYEKSGKRILDSKICLFLC